jgi:hypothetical protein
MGAPQIELRDPGGKIVEADVGKDCHEKIVKAVLWIKNNAPACVI